MEYASSENLPVKVLPLALPDQYVEHGSVSALRKETGLDNETLIRKITETYREL